MCYIFAFEFADFKGALPEGAVGEAD